LLFSNHLLRMSVSTTNRNTSLRDITEYHCYGNNLRPRIPKYYIIDIYSNGQQREHNTTTKSQLLNYVFDSIINLNIPERSKFIIPIHFSKDLSTDGNISRSELPWF